MRSKILKENDLVIIKKWGKTKYEVDAPIQFDPSNKKKYFVTFPFPYMNGRLHLGHVYTMLKADVMARYYLTRGFNVLFPFGYHLTGIPIPAAAAKLKDELSNVNGEKKQYDTMVKMDIDENTISMFTDPLYWTRYFPQMASDIDLPSIGCAIDYRRSFITTEANRYFDSFVRWQMDKLNDKGHIKFGKKMVIYSEKDNQPCSAADRLVGENVEIRHLKIALVQQNNHLYFVTFDASAPPDKVIRSRNFTQSFNKLCTSVVYHGNHMHIYMPPEFYRNFRHQTKLDDVKESYDYNASDLSALNYFLAMDECDLTHGSELYTSDPNLMWIDYYEPESEIISRSGDRCIVAETDQWYIMYDNEKWRSDVYQYVEKSVCFNDESVRNLLLESIKNSHPWPFSRTFGLGSKIPFDEKYLVDSLSDSTIYMAYYTVAHLINQLPVEELSNDVWESIFYGKETNVSNRHLDLFQKMRTEFTYWYPLDLRVSGKDLITNHLTMMFFNHWVIFGAEYMPRAVFVNGHIMINGEKMSKSKGNFITLKQAITKYGTSVTRLVAGCAGDDINDGNFNENEIDTAVLAMYAEVQNWSKMNFNSMRCGDYQFIDHLHLIKLSKLMDRIQCAYNDIRIRDIMQYGFHEIQSIRNKYENPHVDVYKLYLQAELAAMSPIIPHWTEYLSEKYVISTSWPKIKIDPQYDNDKTQWLDTYCQIIMNKLSKCLKKIKKYKPKTCNISINNKIGHFLDEILKHNFTDKTVKKDLLSKFTCKETQNTIIELIRHLEKYGDQFGKDNLAEWLSGDHQYTLQSYFKVCFPQISTVINYTNYGGDTLNPKFSFDPK